MPDLCSFDRSFTRRAEQQFGGVTTDLVLFLARHIESHTTMIIQQLKEKCGECPAFLQSIFKDLSPDLLERLNTEKVIASFNAGDTIIEAGTPFTGVACLQSGSMAVTVGTNEHGTRIYVGTAGEAFGLRDWNVSALNTRDVVGVEPGYYCFIPSDLLNQLCAGEPHLMTCIFNHLCNRIRSVENELGA